MTDDEDMQPGAVVIDLAEASITVRRRSYSPTDCKHNLVSLDLELRAVFCRACKERLDPIEVLKNWAMYFDSERRVIDAATRERAKAWLKRERDHHRRSAGNGKSASCTCALCRFTTNPACKCGHPAGSHTFQSDWTLTGWVCGEKGCRCRAYDSVTGKAFRSTFPPTGRE